MPLNPLHNDSTHPPERAIRTPETMGLIQLPWWFAVALLLPEHSQLHLSYRRLRRVQSPPRRVNGVVVEEVERQDVARATEGHGWPIVAGLWSGDGVNEPSRSEGRMNGRRVLVTFARQKSLAREGETKNISRNAAVRNRHPNNQHKKLAGLVPAKDSLIKHAWPYKSFVTTGHDCAARFVEMVNAIH
jgi:hypothetical protein